jgi:hypothetical protein
MEGSTVDTIKDKALAIAVVAGIAYQVLALVLLMF